MLKALAREKKIRLPKPTGKGGRRPKIPEKKLAAIRRYRIKNPDEAFVSIGRRFKVSYDTVMRALGKGRNIPR